MFESLAPIIDWLKEYGDVLGGIGSIFALTTLALTNGKVIMQRVQRAKNLRLRLSVLRLTAVLSRYLVKMLDLLMLLLLHLNLAAKPLLPFYPSKKLEISQITSLMV